MSMTAPERESRRMTVHRTVVEITESVPAEVEAGTDVRLDVRVTCAGGCDLSGAPIAVLAGGETIVLSSYDCGRNETKDLTIKAPATVGEHAWVVVFRRHEAESAVHEESSCSVHFKTVPHATSMAIWDIPSSPVTVDHPFTLKVGVKCSATCSLGGQTVVVADESGRRVGEGTLSDQPWPDTVALYVAEVSVTAPPVSGLWSWTVGFAETDRPLPHSESSAAFTFLTALAGDHELTIRVTDKHTHAPIDRVEIQCGRYRALTNAQGLAALQLPVGTYHVNAWKRGYDDATLTSVDLRADLLLHLETAQIPETDPDGERVWM
jgi:hypothetical protein